MAESEFDQVKLNLPDGLRDRLKGAADTNRRSLNSEAVARLEASFAVSSSSLDAQLGTLINAHVEQRVQQRLREVAAQLARGAT